MPNSLPVLAACLSALTQRHAAAGRLDLAALGLEGLRSVVEAARAEAQAEVLRVQIKALKQQQADAA